MTRVIRQWIEKSRVRLAVILNYPAKAYSGGPPNVVRTCIVYDLPPSAGVTKVLTHSQAWIGDLRFVIREVKPVQDSETEFKRRQDTFLRADGRTPAEDLPLKQIFKSLLRNTVDYLVSTFGGPLTIVA